VFRAQKPRAAIATRAPDDQGVGVTPRSAEFFPLGRGRWVAGRDLGRRAPIDRAPGEGAGPATGEGGTGLAAAGAGVGVSSNCKSPSGRGTPCGHGKSTGQCESNQALARSAALAWQSPPATRAMKILSLPIARTPSVDRVKPL
jgi:hypothetical protein